MNTEVAKAIVSALYKHGYVKDLSPENEVALLRLIQSACEEAHKDGMKQGWNEGREHERKSRTAQPQSDTKRLLQDCDSLLRECYHSFGDGTETAQRIENVTHRIDAAMRKET